MKELIKEAIDKGYILTFQDCLSDKSGVEIIQLVELYLVVAWLRNTKGFHIEVNGLYNSILGTIEGWNVKVYDYRDSTNPDLPYWNETESFNTYESAMLFGIKTTLEYVQ